MDKKLINNLTEYREWAWQTYQDWDRIGDYEVYVMDYVSLSEFAVRK